MLLGVGCDIVEIARIKRAMEKQSFLRVLSEQERKLFDRIPNARRAEWLAGRFAAKEAVIKAVHKEKSYVLSAVEILSDATGAPTCYIAGLQVGVSISHEKEYAIAYAAAMKE